MEEEIAEALVFWQEFTHTHPEIFYWGTNWEIVLEAENRTIGGIGMGGPPNQHGQVTVGYHIDVRQHRQGFGTEALAGLRDWAMQQDGCTSMVAFTPVNNLPSQKVLARCGFELLEQLEEAGIECYCWRYEASATG
jgi:RimJ/RimL family protein N-acetyltransferase